METKKFNIKFLFFKKSISTYFKINTSFLIRLNKFLEANYKITK